MSYTPTLIQELTRQWKRVPLIGPVGALVPMDAMLEKGDVGLDSLFEWVSGLLTTLNHFIHKIVTDRKDHSFKVWGIGLTKNTLRIRKDG